MELRGMAAIGAFAIVLVVAIMLESRRQHRKYGSTSGGVNLARVGMLEIQSHLQPDRKVEILKVEKKDDAHFALRKQGAPADPPSPE